MSYINFGSPSWPYALCGRDKQEICTRYANLPYGLCKKGHISFKLRWWHWRRLVSCFPLWKKKSVLQLALQLNFWVAMDTCNSLYLYVMSSNEQVAWVAKLQLTIYMVHLIAIKLQFNQNNSFSTTIQLHYDYTQCHDDIINCHPFVKIWHMALWRFLDIKKIQNIDLHRPLWLLMMVGDYDTWHNKKFPHGILMVFWKKNVNIYFSS